MRNEVKYEWTLEIMEDGEVMDSDFSESLTFNKSELQGNDLGLVRYEGNEIDGQTGSVWAYVKDGKLPEFFCDAMGEKTGYKVPARFHKELSKYI
jgi:hypothetical protein